MNVCNFIFCQLMVMDVYCGRTIQIPSLKSSDESIPADCPCGIHAISLNPSQSLLATGAKNTNDLAIYMLPTFDPVMVGEVSHCLSCMNTVHCSIILLYLITKQACKL